jgi:hypothetical protein
LKHGFSDVDDVQKLAKKVQQEGGTLPVDFPTTTDCGNGVVAMFRRPSTSKGAATFIIRSGMIFTDTTETELFKVKISNALTINVADIVVKYLDENFAGKRTESVTAGVKTVLFDLSTFAVSAKMRKHVWLKFREWSKDVVLNQFTFREDNEPCGISIDDLTLRLFFGNDYPIQPDGFSKPMTNAQVTQAQNDVKAVLKAKRQEVEDKCFVSDANMTDATSWRKALRNVALWVIKGELAP